MKKIAVLLVFFFTIVNVFAQFPFKLRYDNNGKTLNGDYIIIGNTLWWNNGVQSYQQNGGNYGNKSGYLNLDTSIAANKPTFASSMQKLNIPQASSSCFKVKKAFFYWMGRVAKKDHYNAAIPKAKLRLPGSNAYLSLTADEYKVNTIQPRGDDTHYYAYKDVTEQIKALINVNGEYWAGDVFSTNNGSWPHGSAWALVIVYEEPSMPQKKVNIYDGWELIGRNLPILTFNMTNLKTPSIGAVKARMGLVSFGAENWAGGDYIKLNGHLMGTTTNNVPNNVKNFFGSGVTFNFIEQTSGLPLRVGNSSFGLYTFDVPNAGNLVIPNNATSAIIETGYTSDGKADEFILTVVGLSVDDDTPDIKLQKRVYNALTNQDVTDGNANMGTPIRYELTFQNVGSDTATDLIIEDILPETFDFDFANANFSYPLGGTVSVSYNSGTRKLTFEVDKAFVPKEGGKHKITFSGKVTANCSMESLRGACSNVIDNKATATYKGEKTPNTTYSTVSYKKYTDNCNAEEGNTKLKINVGSNCTYKAKAAFCTPTLSLSAAAGFDTYSWVKIGSVGTIGNTQTLVVTQPGTYKVTKSKSGCPTLYEEFEVASNTYDTSHPIKDMFDNGQLNGEVYRCPNDGQYYPQVYLCGENAKLQLTVTHLGSTSYEWERLGSCSVVRDKECPPSDNTCTDWTSIGTGETQTITTAGDYRMRINYSGGCMSPYYYFKVTKDTYSGTVDFTPIACGVSATITVNGNTSGYLFALKSGATTVVEYNNTPNFSVDKPGLYTVLIKKVVPQGIIPCVFSADIDIKKNTPTMTITTTDHACSNTPGRIRIVLSDFPTLPVRYILKKDNAAGAL